MTQNIYVAGHAGMAGSAIVRQLQQHKGINILTRSRAELDLENQSQVQSFFAHLKIDQVYLAAAEVGGIHANNAYPADFIYKNLMIECNVIDAAHKNGVEKLMLLGSSCIYPRLASQPMLEEYLLTGPLEQTNEPYAIAKIAGIKLCESYNRQFGRDYRSVMPTNLYGTNDSFHPENSHVIPGLMLRFHQAKIENLPSVSVWGTGSSKREFIYVDDMAEACVHIMNIDRTTYDQHTDQRVSHINIGTGIECSIKQLAESIAQVVGFGGAIEFDRSRPDGTPQKLLSSNKLANLGWQAKTELMPGLEKTYDWFLKQDGNLRGGK